MWKSIGDKFEIRTHNNDDSIRKMRTNGYTIILLTLILIVSRSSFDIYIITEYETDVLRIIKICAYSITAITSFILLIMKYTKNYKEFDLLLLAIIILSVYMLLSVNTNIINYTNYVLNQ